MTKPFWKSPFLAAIVGRPNVGKSTLFNALVGKMIAIVDPTPGVTRDRLIRTITHKEYAFDIMDTGGIGIVDMQDLEDLVELQIQSGISIADLILFTVDARDGITPLDLNVAESLRKTGKRVFVVVNKCDVPKFEFDAHLFHRLGFNDVFTISAIEKRGLDRLLEAICEILPPGSEYEPETGLKLALVGRRNVGKSSFLNAIAGEERVIVSDVPGTTRDAVDVYIETPKYKLVAIDTAGVRKKSSINHPVEFYSTCRTESAIHRADVVVLMIDAKQGISAIEKRLASTVEEEFKPVIITVNKWDLAGDLDPDKYTEYINKTLPGLDHAPIAYISVKDGQRVGSVLKIAEDLYNQYHSTWPTPEINKIVEEAKDIQVPLSSSTKRTKVFYATQVSTAPPTFLFFVNRAKQIPDTYRRFLVNYMRKRLKATEIPFRIIFRERRRSSGDALKA